MIYKYIMEKIETFNIYQEQTSKLYLFDPVILLSIIFIIALLFYKI